MITKIQRIAKDLQLPEHTVAMVLYHYLTDCVQDILIDNECNTLFGKMKLDSDNRLELEKNKFGLIELLNKKNINIIQKIAEDGPEYSIF